MVDKKYNLSQVAEIVNNEGLGYAVQSYLNAEQIEDEKLASLWKECSDKMQEMWEVIEPHIE